jgi:hypothetical protein
MRADELAAGGDHGGLPTYNVNAEGSHLWEVLFAPKQPLARPRTR